MLLQPKNRKYRKDQKGVRKAFGILPAFGVQNPLVFGNHGLKSLERHHLKASQIEAVRRVIIRKIRKIGKSWIRVFPYKPVTNKPTKTRMGKGKGSIQFWVCPVEKGQILFELSANLPPKTVKEIFDPVGRKLPFATKFISSNKLDCV